MVGGKFRGGLAAAVQLLAAAWILTASAQPAPQAGRIADPETNCATSNPFPVNGETIRWTGACRDGLLDGPGILTWYRGGKQHERDEGVFQRGELHGEATITFADGSTIIGNYTEGRRNGEFIIIRADNSYVRAVYQMDRLVSERELSRREVRALIDQRRAGGGARIAAPAPPVAQPAPLPPQAAAPVYQPQPPPQAYAPAILPAPQPLTAPVAPAQPVYGAMQQPPWSPMGTAQRMGLMPQPQGIPVQAAPPSPVATYRPMAYRMPSYPAPVAQAVDMDSYFVQAFALERAGQYQQAHGLYQAIAVSSPGTPAANLAAERMALLAAYAPPPPPPAAQPSVQAAFTPPPAIQRASLQGRRVCSARGLYPSDGRWCGIVREEDGYEIMVEVAEVKTNAFFTIGFAASECTGGRFLTWFSRGSSVWVPASCMR